MKTYKEQIIDSINELWEARNKVFGLLVSMAMSNDLKEIDDAFEIGDIFYFEYAHFEDISDPNIQALISLSKQMDQTIETMMNINDIKANEINLP
jgi:hypothetical protein